MRYTITAILTALILTACGGTVDNGPEPTCDDDDYRDSHLEECIGESAYEEHKDRVVEEVRTLRDNRVNPSGDGDIAECDDGVPTHICTETEGPKCQWGAFRTYGEGSRYVAKCKCIAEYKVEQGQRACDGL